MRSGEAGRTSSAIVGEGAGVAGGRVSGKRGSGGVGRPIRSASVLGLDSVAGGSSSIGIAARAVDCRRGARGPGPGVVGPPGTGASGEGAEAWAAGGAAAGRGDSGKRDAGGDAGSAVELGARAGGVEGGGVPKPSVIGDAGGLEEDGGCSEGTFAPLAGACVEAGCVVELGVAPKPSVIGAGDDGVLGTEAEDGWAGDAAGLAPSTGGDAGAGGRAAGDAAGLAPSTGGDAGAGGRAAGDAAGLAPSTGGDAGAAGGLGAAAGLTPSTGGDAGAAGGLGAAAGLTPSTGGDAGAAGGLGAAASTGGAENAVGPASGIGAGGLGIAGPTAGLTPSTGGMQARRAAWAQRPARAERRKPWDRFRGLARAGTEAAVPRRPSPEDGALLEAPPQRASTALARRQAASWDVRWQARPRRRQGPGRSADQRRGVSGRGSRGWRPPASTGLGQPELRPVPACRPPGRGEEWWRHAVVEDPMGGQPSWQPGGSPDASARPSSERRWEGVARWTASRACRWSSSYGATRAWCRSGWGPGRDPGCPAPRLVSRQADRESSPFGEPPNQLETRRPGPRSAPVTDPVWG